MDDIVNKSPNDSSSYRYTCLENRMKVLLVSKEDSSMSTVGLCVGIGSFKDPAEVQGLAHLLEHVLFLGSAKFPKENDFDEFIGSNGGTSNAETDLEWTVFHFDVKLGYLEPALERFVEFFKKPLLNDNAVKRERDLVHAEWSMVVQNDQVRFEQLLRSTVKQHHPMGLFAWGNTESLQTVPDESGINVTASLKDFHEKNYKGQFMTLCIISNEPLDVLQSWAKNICTSIPHNDDEKPSFLDIERPFETPEFTKIYKVLPIKNICQLRLTWAFQSQLQQYRSKPLVYLSNLLCYKGTGSLIALLRNRNLAKDIHNVYDQRGEEDNSTVAQFGVVINLTEDGLANFVEVISHVFSYLSMIRNVGPQKEFWEEMKQICWNQFMWTEPEDMQEFTRDVCINMQRYNPEDFLHGGKLMFDFDEKIIQTYLDELRPDNVNIALWSKSFTAETVLICQEEKWFKTAYYVQDIQTDWLQKWNECRSGASSDFSFPEKNEYIALDFTLKDPDLTLSLDEPLSSSITSRLWFEPDNDFLLPKAYFNFYFKSVEADRSVTNQCLLEIYVMLLRHHLTAICYPAKFAHLSYAVQVFDRGMILRLNGFNAKLPDLFKTLIDSISSLEIDDRLFNTGVRDLASLYDNILLKPETLNRDLKKSLLLTKHHSVIEKQPALQGIEKKQLDEFVKIFYKHVFIEGLVQGNVTGEEALDLETYMLSKLDVTPVDYPDALAQVLLTKIPSASSTYTVTNQNLNDNNCVFTRYIQLGLVDSEQLNQLIVNDMEEKSATELVTKRQLGYEVRLAPENSYGIIGLDLTVFSQATKFTMEELAREVDAFFLMYNAESLQKMSASRFNEMISTAIEEKNSDHSSLSDSVHQHWNEILQQLYRFKNHKVEVEQLKKLTLGDVKSWGKDVLTPNASRRKLTIEVMGHGQRLPSDQQNITKRSKKDFNETHKKIKSIESFKSECDTFTIRQKR